jgi:hypothetical protein
MLHISENRSQKFQITVIQIIRQEKTPKVPGKNKNTGRLSINCAHPDGAIWIVWGTS